MPAVNESRASARATPAIPVAPSAVSEPVVPEQTVRPTPTSPERASPVVNPKPAPRRGHLKARAILIGLVLLVVSGIAYALRPKPMTVDIAAASFGPMQVSV